jgi:hypothetical protein
MTAYDFEAIKVITTGAAYAIFLINLRRDMESSPSISFCPFFSLVLSIFIPPSYWLWLLMMEIWHLILIKGHQ